MPVDIEAVIRVLVEECGLSTEHIWHHEGLTEFLGEDCSSDEYRFGGFLGTGGKLYKHPDHLRIGFYPEDSTPERVAAQAKANVRLAELWAVVEDDSP